MAASIPTGRGGPRPRSGNPRCRSPLAHMAAAELSPDWEKHTSKSSGDSCVMASWPLLETGHTRTQSVTPSVHCVPQILLQHRDRREHLRFPRGGARRRCRSGCRIHRRNRQPQFRWWRGRSRRRRCGRRARHLSPRRAAARLGRSVLVEHR